MFGAGKRELALLESLKKFEELAERNARLRDDLMSTMGQSARLEIENARLRADMDWFKLRMNAVEKERAQLIAAAIGVKISIPEFQTVNHDAAVKDALNEMQDVSTVGGDAHEDDDEGRMKLPGEQAVDFSLMPGYRKQE